MQNTKHLLIGGGLASYRAARRIRKLDSSSPILLVGGEPHVPYNRPPLTKEWMQGKSELIQHKVPVADREKQLADPGFEVGKLQEKAAVSTRP